MRFFYNLFIYLYGLFILAASLFNKKAKLWVNGRKNIFENLQKTTPLNQSIFWIHCASLGEFEQGRPLIEKVKKEHPEYFILLTFFSPSGYEIRKNYVSADAVFYLPLDTKKNAAHFLSIVKPKIVCFVKYEFWFNYINEIKKQNIPIYLISAILRPKQYFFKWYGNWALQQLKNITYFFAQDVQTEQLLLKSGITQTSISGDTRFDRVAELVTQRKEISIAQEFTLNKKTLVCGSTWPIDDELIIESLKTNTALNLIVAPHELNENALTETEKKYSELGTVLRYSKANAANINHARVLLIDNIGMLSSLYYYGYIAYIGGGFGKGIHNILEAATFGKPVFFGPNYKKFNEATELLKRNGAAVIANTSDLKSNINELLNNTELYKQKSEICLNYVFKQQGATQKIVNFIFN